MLFARFAADSGFSGFEFCVASGGQQFQISLLSGADLLHRALLRVFVRAPSQKAGAVAEAAASEMIITDLDDQLGRQWLPLH